MNEETKLIVVYGSLKNGKYNHYLLEDAEYLGGKMVHGTMQMNGSYPYLFDNMAIKKKAKQYDGEIYRVTQKRYDQITRMEISAGYYERQISTDFGMATVYMTQPQLFSKEKSIVEKY